MIGAFIVVLLALQTGVVATMFDDRLYPFINYPMYTRVHMENEYVGVEYLVYMRLPSGEDVRVLPADLGMTFFKLVAHSVSVLLGSEEEAQILMELYEKRSGRAVAALRIDSYPAIITRNGMQEAPSTTLALVARQKVTEP